MKKIRPSIYNRILFKINPKIGFRKLLKSNGAENESYEKLHDVFSKTKRADIFKTAGGERGFILILDQKTALFFYQDGDHFKYDGFEIGEYGKGEVAIFDK